MSDVENGNVTNSKHGSLSTLNMEWDNQGFRLFKLPDLFFDKIQIFTSDCFKEEDFKEKIFQEQNRLNRNKYMQRNLDIETNSHLFDLKEVSIFLLIFYKTGEITSCLVPDLPC